jgi:hypothetical protein
MACAADGAVCRAGDEDGDVRKEKVGQDPARSTASFFVKCMERERDRKRERATPSVAAAECELCVSPLLLLQLRTLFFRRATRFYLQPLPICPPRLQRPQSRVESEIPIGST